MSRCPAKEGTTGEEYIRFWVHALECTCKLADDNGASAAQLSAWHAACQPCPSTPGAACTCCGRRELDWGNYHVITGSTEEV